MKNWLFSLWIIFSVKSNSILSIGQNSQDEIPVKGYSLAWQDEFSGISLDKAKWNYRALGKRGDAYNLERQVKLDGNGYLVIEVKRSGDSILSGMISTENLFQTRYGYFECRAKLTRAKGVFPSFWIQSPLINNQKDPSEAGAELDIFEYFPNEKKDFVSHTLHWGGYGATHKVAGPIWTPIKPTRDGFHVFGLEWTPTEYSTFVDGIKTYTGNTLISKVSEYMILSVGVDKNIAGQLEEELLPDQFIIDYVRVYKKDEKKN